MVGIVNETSGGYTKYETPTGGNYYRGPDGDTVPQTSYAASRGGEVTAEKYDMDRDENGQFTGDRELTEPEPTEPEPTEPPEPPEPPAGPNVRVTGTLNVDTDEVRGYAGTDRTTVQIEIGGVFRPGTDPPDGDVKRKLSVLAEEASEQLPFVEDYETNISRVDTQAAATGWRGGGLDITLEGTRDHTYDYDVDPAQERIRDFK